MILVNSVNQKHPNQLLYLESWTTDSYESIISIESKASKVFWFLNNWFFRVVFSESTTTPLSSNGENV